MMNINCPHMAILRAVRAKISETVANEYANPKAYELGNLAAACDSLKKILERPFAPASSVDECPPFGPHRLEVNELLVMGALYQKMGLPFVINASAADARCPCEDEGDQREFVRWLAVMVADETIAPYQLGRLATAASKLHTWCVTGNADGVRGHATTWTKTSDGKARAADCTCVGCSEIGRLSLEETRTLRALFAKGMATR